MPFFLGKLRFANLCHRWGKGENGAFSAAQPPPYL